MSNENKVIIPEICEEKKFKVKELYLKEEQHLDRLLKTNSFIMEKLFGDNNHEDNM